MSLLKWLIMTATTANALRPSISGRYRLFIDNLSLILIDIKTCKNKFTRKFKKFQKDTGGRKIGRPVGNPIPQPHPDQLGKKSNLPLLIGLGALAYILFKK